MVRQHRLVIRISEQEYLPVRLKLATEHARLSVVVRSLLAAWVSNGIMVSSEPSNQLSGHPDALEGAGPGPRGDVVVSAGRSAITVSRPGYKGPGKRSRRKRSR